MRSARLFLFPLLFLILLLAPPPDRSAGQTPAVQSGTWNQPGSARWQAGTLANLRVRADGALELVPPYGSLGGAGTYTSPVGTADFPFTHLVARWTATVPHGTSLVVEIRARAAGGDWTPWVPLFDPQPTDAPDGPENRLQVQAGIFGENLLALRNGREMQAQVTFVTAHPQLSPLLHSLDLIYLDASQGPTAEPAAKQAEVKVSKEIAGAPSPPIIPRSGWGADESWMTWPPQYSPVRKIVVHHTVTENDEPDPAATVRAIYYYHAIVRGWGDIGYNFLVDRFGNIYEGRAGGLDVIGGHAYGYNVGSLGIGNLGTFGNADGSVWPTQEMLDSISEISAWTASRRLFHPQASSFFYDRYTPNITGHRDYGTTACPGDYLFSDLPAVRDAAWAVLDAYTPDYFSRWGDHTTPGRMAAGDTIAVEMEVQNAGSMTWPAGGANPVRLGYHWVDANGQVVPLPPEADHRSPLPSDAPFAAAVNWAGALLTAPTTPGNYTLRWDLVHEAVTWFADRGSPILAVPVKVVQLEDQAFVPLLQSRPGFPTPPPTPTPIPDPTPTPDPCSQVVVNPGFESDEAWVLNDTPADAHYTDSPVYAGSRALRAGIPAGGQNQYSYSSADQEVVIPGGMSSVQLSFWYFPLADDDAGDFHYLMIRDAGGAWHTVFSGRENRGTWVFAEIDLQAYLGQTITLRIGAFNDGTEGVSSLTVDQVELRVCP
jgi:hypothetical protein